MLLRYNDDLTIGYNSLQFAIYSTQVEQLLSVCIIHIFTWNL